MPADWIRNTNGPALPSMIGTSPAVSSMKRLSMPRPASADIRCSTVDTPASPAASVVPSVVSVTFVARAGMSTGGSRSVRRNTMPVLGGAGLSTIRTLRPVCRPMPVDRIESLSVRCCAMTMPSRKLPHQEPLIRVAGRRPAEEGRRPISLAHGVTGGSRSRIRSARRPDARRRARRRNRTARSPSRSARLRAMCRLSPPGAGGMPGCRARPPSQSWREARRPPRAAAGDGPPAGRGGCSPVPARDRAAPPA